MMKRFLLKFITGAPTPHEPISRMVREELEVMHMADRFERLAARQRKNRDHQGT